MVSSESDDEEAASLLSEIGRSSGALCSPKGVLGCAFVAIPVLLVAVPLLAGRHTTATRLTGIAGVQLENADVPSPGFSRCSREDHEFLQNVRRDDPQSFFKSMSDCAKTSISWFLAFEEDSFVGCMQQGQYRSLSKPCLGCYSDNSKYAVDNCKLLCFASWCSAGCLGCTAENENVFAACSGKRGHELPEAQQC